MSIFQNYTAKNGTCFVYSCSQGKDGFGIMDAIINTVSTIFKERYGAQLKIEKKNGGVENKPDFLGRWHSPFVYSRTLRQVSFPIFNSKRELQAIAVASPVENTDAIVFDEMAQFLQLTIAEHIDLTEKKSMSERTQWALESVHDESRNIIQLKTKKIEPEKNIQYKKIEAKKQPDLRPLWISGKNENFNAHIAFSIHDWAANWAFINAAEIPDLIWQDPHAWQNFPQVTIFVPNITSLSEGKLKTLETNLKSLRQLKGPKPLIIISSPLEVSEKLERIKRLFKHYRSNEKVTARVQAHFLLYHHKEETPWVHQCEVTNSLYFLPFSSGPKNFH